MAYRKQKGFTLIELLIVIIVLGIMAAVMLLSSLEAISTADTATIINNLTGLKKATTAWYWDNLERLVKDGSKYMVETNGVRQEVKDFIRAHGAEIVKYLDNGSSITLKVAGTDIPADSYCFQTLNNGKEWYMGYKFFKDNNEKDEGMINFMSKFESRASSLNLISITNADKNTAKAEKFGANKDKYVYILVLKLED